MAVFFDQLGRSVSLDATPVRIISLVPSQTELLFDLGAGERVVGVTSFCIHPQQAQQKMIVGGTKRLNTDLINVLKPDLIIANKEENERGQIEQLMRDHKVWISDINRLNDAVDMITKLGELIGLPQQAAAIKTGIGTNFNKLTTHTSALKTLYLIWRKPYMAAGTGTFIHDIVQRCGFVNAVEMDRYPQLSVEAIQDLCPDVIFLSSEPYPFKEKHITELQLIVPKAKIKLVDGELFSWYGSRLLHSVPYFQQLIKSV
jgi:ABC-type hemin transport system substrate-binding protein